MFIGLVEQKCYIWKQIEKRGISQITNIRRGYLALFVLLVRQFIFSNKYISNGKVLCKKAEKSHSTKAGDE